MDSVLKLSFDIISSSIGLAFLSPLLLVICLFIKLDSRGPVFYKGLRLGRFGKRFRMLKFRTMVPDAERIGVLATPEGDPRVTRVGEFIRKFKLDELPQLLNVVRGEMSLVGPRPEAPLFFEYYAEEEKNAILSVRPGMTDYGSLRFHDEGKLLTGSDNPVKAYVERVMHEKIALQLRYIEERSFWGDIKIIFATIKTIIHTRLSKEV